MNRVKTGALIKEQRISKNLTEQKLAAMTGISVELLESYENGTALFRASVLKEMAKALDLSLIDLMHGHKSPSLSRKNKTSGNEKPAFTNSASPTGKPVGSSAYEEATCHTIGMDLIQTAYDYREHYWIIDGKPIVIYLDEWVRNGMCPGLEPFGSLLGLMPAWTGELEWAAENRFIWEMIDSPETLNVPILVCEDDCDLSCIVILARIRKTLEYVCWEKLGMLLRSSEDFNLEKSSGILCLEAYTEEDWEKYGDNIACERPDSREYWEWVSNHWEEELIRRRRNYTKPFMQREENIRWIAQPNWIFKRAGYDQMVEAFREVYNCAANKGS